MSNSFQVAPNVKKYRVLWLGCGCGTTSFQNPAVTGMVSVKSSGLMKDSTPSETILGKELVRCVTKPIKEAWYVIDFVNYRKGANFRVGKNNLPTSILEQSVP